MQKSVQNLYKQVKRSGDAVRYFTRRIRSDIYQTGSGSNLSGQQRHFCTLFLLQDPGAETGIGSRSIEILKPDPDPEKFENQIKAKVPDPWVYGLKKLA